MTHEHPSEPMSLAELESYLATGADLLRGAIDQADFKAYIFPLMFFKRISDVYLEEYSRALDESGGDHEFASFAENHRFAIPEGSPVGRTCAAAPRTSAGAADGVPRDREGQPRDALRHLRQRAPGPTRTSCPTAKLARPDRALLHQDADQRRRAAGRLRQAYEYLIKRFADQSNKKAGEYYTPRSVVRLLVNILDPQEGETVYDPACGTGGMLIEVIEHVKARWRTAARPCGASCTARRRSSPPPPSPG